MIIIKVECDECHKSYDIEKVSFLEIIGVSKYKCPKCGSYSYSIGYIAYPEDSGKMKIGKKIKEYLKNPKKGL